MKRIVLTQEEIKLANLALHLLRVMESSRAIHNPKNKAIRADLRKSDLNMGDIEGLRRKFADLED